MYDFLFLFSYMLLYLLNRLIATPINTLIAKMKAEIIRDVLFDNGYKLVDVAKDLGISTQHLNNMWSTKDVKIGTLLRFVEVTDIPIIDFLIRCEHVNEVDESFGKQFKILKEHEIKEREESERILQSKNRHI